MFVLCGCLCSRGASQLFIFFPALGIALNPVAGVACSSASFPLRQSLCKAVFAFAKILAFFPTVQLLENCGLGSCYAL